MAYHRIAPRPLSVSRPTPAQQISTQQASEQLGAVSLGSVVSALPLLGLFVVAAYFASRD